MAKAIEGIGKEDVEHVRELIKENVLDQIVAGANAGKWVNVQYFVDYGVGSYVEDDFLQKQLSSDFTPERLMIAKLLCFLTMLEAENAACSNLYARQLTETDIKKFFIENHDAFELTIVRANESFEFRSIDEYLKERMQTQVLDPLNVILQQWLEENQGKDSQSIEQEEFAKLEKQLKTYCSQEFLTSPGYISSSIIGSTLVQHPKTLERADAVKYNEVLTTIYERAASKSILGSAAFMPIVIILETCASDLADQLILGLEQDIRDHVTDIDDMIISTVVEYVRNTYKDYVAKQWEKVSHADATETAIPASSQENLDDIEEGDLATPRDGAEVTGVAASASNQDQVGLGSVAADIFATPNADAEVTEDTVLSSPQGNLDDIEGDTATPGDGAGVTGVAASASNQDQVGLGSVAVDIFATPNANAEVTEDTVLSSPQGDSTEKTTFLKLGVNTIDVKFETEEGSNYFHIHIDQPVTFDEDGQLLIGGEKAFFEPGNNIAIHSLEGLVVVVTSFGKTQVRQEIIKTPPSSPVKPIEDMNCSHEEGSVYDMEGGVGVLIVGEV